MDACKDAASYPSIKNLLQDPFFNEVASGSCRLIKRIYISFAEDVRDAKNITFKACILFSDGSKDGTRPYLKFSLNSKEALSKYKESIRKQLQNDYTKVRPNSPHMINNLLQLYLELIIRNY